MSWREHEEIEQSCADVVQERLEEVVGDFEAYDVMALECDRHNRLEVELRHKYSRRRLTVGFNHKL